MEPKNTIQMRRKALQDLIEKNTIEDQETLLELMRKHYGLTTSQAVISRDLRALGVSKRSIKDKTIYELPATDPSKEILRLAVVDIQNNESTIVIHTLPGLAAFVGDYLDMFHQELNLIGTIAGENIVLVIPKSANKITEIVHALHKKLYIQSKETHG